MVGKILRTHRITKKDGRTLIVAMDHALQGSFYGLEDIEDVVKKVMEGGADAVMVNWGMAKKIAEVIKGQMGLIISIPYDINYVKLAIKLGADGIKTTYFGPIPLSEERLKQIGEIALAAEDWGIPYIVELVPTDGEGKILYNIELIKRAARIASELGGDIVKTAYIGKSHEYKEVVKACKLPIVIMGGEKMNNLYDFLKMVRDSLEAGVIGGAIGRNIWQYKDPKRITEVLIGIIHDGLDVNEALERLKKG